MVMSRWIAFIATAALLPAPLLATPPAKKAPHCQSFKAPARDAKRPESCRKTPAIPPVIDPTPLFLASTGEARTAAARLS